MVISKRKGRPWHFEAMNYGLDVDRDLVYQHKLFSEERMRSPGGNETSVLLLPSTSVKGLPLVCVLLCTLFHLEGTQKYLRSLGSSKFAWLSLGAVPISLLLDLHLLLSYCCLHPTSTTQRRENSVVSQFRGFTSHGRTVVHVIPWQARERERGMSVFSVFSPPSPKLFQPMKWCFPHVWQVFLIDTSGVVPE